MKDRKFQNKQLQDDYPNPGVPADDAWAAMNTMLDAGTHPQQPPAKHGMPGGSKLFWYIASLAVIVIGVLWLVYNRESSTKVSKSKAQVIRTKKETRLQQNVANASGNNAGAVGKQDSNYGNVAINDNAFRSSRAGTAIHPVDAGGETLPGANGATSASRSNGQNVAGNSDITATVKRGGKLPNDKRKNNAGVYHERQGNIASYLPGDTDGNGSKINPRRGSLKPGVANHVFEKGEDKAGLNAVTYSADTDLVHNTENIGGPDVTGLASSAAQFLIVHTHLEVDSSYLQKLNKEMMGMASSKKGKMKSTGKLKSTNKKTPGFEYGFQWELPLPVQGTAKYGTSTNGKANAFNLLLPQLWISKGIGHKSKVFVAIDFKQQYIVNHKQLDGVVMFTGPRDTGVTKTSLYKIGGFGGIIAWSYEINRHWGASLGINYTLNRTALLDKQNTNFYTGKIISDSLYTIDRYSADWQYINKSVLAAHLELYYIFKKFNVGASASLPLNTIPVYDKKIRPVNAQLFIRWNIKK